MTQDRPGLHDYALLIALSAIWGSSFTCIRVAVETIPAATLTASRLGIAAMMLIVVALLARQSLPYTPRIWLAITASAILGNALPFTLISWGEEAVESGLAAILMAVMPLITLVLAHIFTRDEKLGWRKAAGVVLGLLGLVVLIGPSALSGLGEEIVRQLAIAAAAACYGINALVTKTLMGLPRRALAAALMTVSATIMIPASLIFDEPWQLEPSGESALSALVLGVLQTGIATLLMFTIIRRRGATFFSQINYLVPVFGVFWGVVLLAETLPPSAIAALVIIMSGVAVARGEMVLRTARPQPGTSDPK